MADGLPHTKGVAVGWFAASFYFSCGEGEGEQKEHCSFSWQSTKITGLWKTSEEVISLETQFFTDQQHWTCSTVSLGHGIVAHVASIGREKSGTFRVSWGEPQLLIQQPSTCSGKDGTKSMTLSSNLAFPKETHKIEKVPKIWRKLVCEKRWKGRTQVSGKSSSSATAQESRQKQRRSKPKEKTKSQGEDAAATEKRKTGDACGLQQRATLLCRSSFLFFPFFCSPSRSLAFILQFWSKCCA